MYYFLIVVHILVCIFLILVVLLQAGRGGGMSEMIGGGQPQSLFGTQTNAFMTRITEVVAVLFVVTSLTLGILTTQRGRSLVAGRASLTAALPAAPADKAGQSEAQDALNALLAESKKDAPVAAEATATATVTPSAAPATSGGDKS